jgi:hypothetical protein
MSEVPDVVPQVEENEMIDVNLNDNDEDAIDLMDGVGLKKPVPVETDEVFKEKIEKKEEQGDVEEDTPPEETKPEEDLTSYTTPKATVKVNKNGKPRKPMTKERLEKLAEARKKALATRQRNKKLKEEQQKTLKIQKIVDNDQEVIIKPKVQKEEPNVIIQPRVKKLSREEKDKKIQDAVAEGVKKALEVERQERKQRKELKKKKIEEEKEIKEQLLKDKQVSDTLSKLNDIDNIYGKCFNFV